MAEVGAGERGVELDEEVGLAAGLLEGLLDGLTTGAAELLLAGVVVVLDELLDTRLEEDLDDVAGLPEGGFEVLWVAPPLPAVT